MNIFINQSASEPSNGLICIDEILKLKNGTMGKSGKFQRKGIFNSDRGQLVYFGKSLRGELG